MAIPPVKPGGWAQYGTVRNAEYAQIDERLASRGLDSRGADSVTGTLSLRQDPLNPGTPPKLTIPAAHSLFVDAPGAKARTQDGGRFVLGANDVPTYNAPRTRTVRYSALEACRSSPYGHVFGVQGNRLVVHAPSGGITSGSALVSDVFFALPKPHDGATLASIKVWFFFFLDPGGTVSLVRAAARIAPAVGGIGGVAVVNGIGGVTSAFSYNAGLPQSAGFGAGFTNAVLDLSQYDHVFFLRGDLRKISVTAIEVGYSAINDERFSQ